MTQGIIQGMHYTQVRTQTQGMSHSEAKLLSIVNLQSQIIYVLPIYNEETGIQ